MRILPILISSLLVTPAAAQMLPPAAPSGATTATFGAAPETIEIDGKRLPRGWRIEVEPLRHISSTIEQTGLRAYAYNAPRLAPHDRFAQAVGRGYDFGAALHFSGYFVPPAGEFKIRASAPNNHPCVLVVEIDGTEILRGQIARPLTSESFQEDPKPLPIGGTLTCDPSQAHWGETFRNFVATLELEDPTGRRAPLVAFSEAVPSRPNPRPNTAPLWASRPVGKEWRDAAPSSLALDTSNLIGMAPSEVRQTFALGLSLAAGKHQIFVAIDVGRGALSASGNCLASLRLSNPRFPLVNRMQSERERGDASIDASNLRANGSAEQKGLLSFAGEIEIPAERAKSPLQFELDVHTCGILADAQRGPTVQILIRSADEPSWRALDASEVVKAEFTR